MFVNKRYLYEAASPHSQEGIKALQCESDCVKKIRHIKRKLKDLTSPIFGSEGKHSENLLFPVLSLESKEGNLHQHTGSWDGSGPGQMCALHSAPGAMEKKPRTTVISASATVS